MKRLLDTNPVLGTTEYFEYDDMTDKITVRVEQDVTPFLEYARKVRNEPDIGKAQIKDGFWHYAELPDIVIMELRQKGIDVFNPNQTKEILREINANYPYLKLTDKRVA